MQFVRLISCLLMAQYLFGVVPLTERLNNRLPAERSREGTLLFIDHQRKLWVATGWPT